MIALTIFSSLRGPAVVFLTKVTSLVTIVEIIKKLEKKANYYTEIKV